MKRAHGLGKLCHRKYGIFLKLPHEGRDRKSGIRVFKHKVRLSGRRSLADQVKTFLPLDQSPEECPLLGRRMEEIVVLRPDDRDILADLLKDLPADFTLTGSRLLHKEFQALLALIVRLCGHCD